MSYSKKYNDNIKQKLDDITKKEELLLYRYKDLKDLKNYLKNKKETNLEELNEKINTEIKNLYLLITYKKEILEKQNLALLNLLEYFNSLHEDKKNLYINQTLIKINFLEENLKKLNRYI
tara:strand:- start:324 stop:683 length:360 start_codon:yes stop_codon:yes gene_type:complete